MGWSLHLNQQVDILVASGNKDAHLFGEVGIERQRVSDFTAREFTE